MVALSDGLLRPLMAQHVPSEISEAWELIAGGDRLHNRYVLTDLGGVSLGVGFDAGGAGETDDLLLLLLLPQEQYVRRWAQYAKEDGSFDLGDTPAAIVGARARRGGRGH